MENGGVGGGKIKWVKRDLSGQTGVECCQLLLGEGGGKRGM